MLATVNEATVGRLPLTARRPLGFSFHRDYAFDHGELQGQGEAYYHHFKYYYYYYYYHYYYYTITITITISVMIMTSTMFRIRIPPLDFAAARISAKTPRSAILYCN